MGNLTFLKQTKTTIAQLRCIFKTFHCFIVFIFILKMPILLLCYQLYLQLFIIYI